MGTRVPACEDARRSHQRGQSDDCMQANHSVTVAALLPTPLKVWAWRFRAPAAPPHMALQMSRLTAQSRAVTACIAVSFLLPPPPPSGSHLDVCDVRVERQPRDSMHQDALMQCGPSPGRSLGGVRRMEGGGVEAKEGEGGVQARRGLGVYVVSAPAHAHAGSVALAWLLPGEVEGGGRGV